MTAQTASTLDHRPLRRFDVGGTHVLERAGDGPAVVFLHGIGANANSFVPVLERCPPGPRLLAWNAPGYLSSRPLDVAAPTAQDYAAVLTQMLDLLELTQAHIVGHSLGTLIAAAFAQRTPGRVASLTLAAAAQGYGVPAGAPLGAGPAKRLEDLADLGPVAFAEARAARLVHQPENNPKVVAQVRDAMARINPGGYAQAVHMLAGGDLAASVAQVTCKPGFIIGAGDQVTPIAQTRSAMQAWHAVHGETPRCITIPDAGHAVYVQQPQAFVSALLDLVPALKRQPAQGATEERHGG